MGRWIAFALVAAATTMMMAKPAAALNNGVGLTPSMGFNTWYALHSYLTYPNYTWVPGFVLGYEAVSIASFMKEKGFLAAGYSFLNFDDCIVVGRNASGFLIPDPQAFPLGVKYVASSLNQLGFKLGWYSDRGNFTCSCWAGGLQRPGSLGHEAQDAAWYAEQGIEYLKEDSCNAPGGTPGAFEQYGAMRDGLNATGSPIVFNLCWGAGETVAASGRTYGNEWRIAEDDGGGWGPILVNVNQDLSLGSYAGCVADPRGGVNCGWNDPGLLLVGDPSLTLAQQRTHFALWSVLASKLLMSMDPRNFTQAELDIVLNPEIIAVDQDPAGRQGTRLVPPAAAVSSTSPSSSSSSSSDQALLARRALRGALPHVPAFLRPWFEDTGGQGHSEDEDVAFRPPHGYAHKYLAVRWSHLRRQDGRAAEADAEERAWRAARGLDIPVGGGQGEVWARSLQDGSWALLFFNNNVTGTADIACAGPCWSALGFNETQTVFVRDLWARQSLPPVTGGFTARAVPTDDNVFVRVKGSPIDE